LEVYFLTHLFIGMFKQIVVGFLLLAG
jgi:hypothetical protein